MTRRGSFWATGVVACSVVLLSVGSQIARDRGQSVDWYTGFGQWLGALASFIAAGAALWIATTDRRHALEDRRRAESEREADLARQAGLVRVSADRLGKRQPMGPMIKTAAVGIRNRRLERIFDIEVVNFVHQGKSTDLRLARVHGYEIFPLRDAASFPRGTIDHVVLQQDEQLVLYHPSGMSGAPADFVAIRYTDPSGRRWEVDTNGSTKRVEAPRPGD